MPHRCFFLHRLLVWSLLIVPVFSSCRKPSVYERFVQNNDCTEAGVYDFVVDMSDSLATYDVSLYTRVDGDHSGENTSVGVLVDVAWKSPSGIVYSEKVYFPFSEGTEFFSRQAVMPYRVDTVPVEYGLWELSLRPQVDIAGLRGWGVKCVRKNGTR